MDKDGDDDVVRKRRKATTRAMQKTMMRLSGLQ